MRCLSCQVETPSTKACQVLGVFMCTSCGALAHKAVLELERESARALELSKQVLSEHILKGGLLRAGKE